MSISSILSGECPSYCKHGGVCRLKDKHEGKHNSSYCEWDEEESLTKGEADNILRQKMEKKKYPEKLIKMMEILF